ncbi:MAG: NADH-quinone oxidoreductase subunit A [Candidatus Rokubacteria bacterium]|nr:NADH-quinone oxidoreductase subunit A [Candidatus Rokubacteria bacterium]
MQYVPILMVFAFAAAVAGLMLLVPRLLGPRRPSPVKLEAFECGKPPLALPEGRFAVKFSVTAIMFIIFDIELMFVFPWVVVYGEFVRAGLGPFAFFAMLFYLAVLMLGLLYDWRKGGLEWE